MTQPDLPQVAARQWIGLVVLALPCILYAMDLTILNLAVPSLAADLKPTAAQLLWIVDVYGFFIAGSLLTMGALGDRIGRRTLLLIGAAGFAIVSLVAAFARTAEMLIVARALLGVAGATLAPSTLSLISTMFPEGRQRTFAIGVWVASFSLGGALGPVVGGLVLTRFDWNAIFVIPVPVMLLLLVLGPIFLPEYKSPTPPRLDPLSAAMSFAAVLPTIYGIKLIAEGDGLVGAAASIIIGLGFAALFARRQMHLVNPLLDLQLFRVPALTAALVVNTLDFFVGFGIFLLVAQYLQLVLGFSPFEAGLWSLPTGVGFVAGSLLTAPLLRLMRPAYVLGSGLGLGALGLVLMSQISGSSGLLLLVIGNFLFAIGTAPCTAIAAELTVSAAPAERAGSASALNETSSEFGGALGIALLGSLTTFLYRASLGSVLPPDLPADARSIALRGVGSAIGLARSASTADATLLTSARSAYVSASSATLLTAAVIVAISAIWAVLALRTLPQKR